MTEPADSTFVSHIRFDVKPGQREAFLDAFAATGMLTRPTSVTGFCWGKLVEATDGSHFMVIAAWETEAAYAQWQSTAMKDVDRDAVIAFVETLSNPAPGKLFRIVAHSEARRD